MLNRLKRILELSRYDLDKLDLTDALIETRAMQPDGKPDGAFLDDMTEAEYVAWERKQDEGWSKWDERIKQILKLK